MQSHLTTRCNKYYLSDAFHINVSFRLCQSESVICGGFGLYYMIRCSFYCVHLMLIAQTESESYQETWACPLQHTTTHTNAYTPVPHLSVFLQVGPHARPITPSHQHMVGEVVDARQRAGELAGTRLIVVPYIGHHVIEFEHLAPFVLFPQASVEGDLGTVEGRAVTTWSRPRRTRWTRLARLSGRAFGTRWTWKSGAPSETLFAPAAREVWGLRGDGCHLSLWGGESVTHHLAAPQHLIVGAPSSGTSAFRGVDQ